MAAEAAAVPSSHLLLHLHDKSHVNPRPAAEQPFAQGERDCIWCRCLAPGQSQFAVPAWPALPHTAPRPPKKPHCSGGIDLAGWHAKQWIDLSGWHCHQPTDLLEGVEAGGEMLLGAGPLQPCTAWHGCPGRQAQQSMDVTLLLLLMLWGEQLAQVLLLCMQLGDRTTRHPKVTHACLPKHLPLAGRSRQGGQAGLSSIQAGAGGRGGPKVWRRVGGGRLQPLPHAQRRLLQRLRLRLRLLLASDCPRGIPPPGLRLLLLGFQSPPLDVLGHILKGAVRLTGMLDLQVGGEVLHVVPVQNV